MTAREPDRRSVLRAGAAITIAGFSVSVISGCGGGKNSPGTQAAATVNELSDQAKQAIAAAITSGKVAVGKPAFLPDAQVIVTEPTRGQYRVFSNICTHQAARVDQVNAKGNLVCSLHGSEFDPATGEAKVGPAGKPLPSKVATVSGNQVTIS
ncbi:MAG: Rieske (2Fe-2S) protein [Austwickia sp.]|nr:Rieske (2Fe-2S) protein [Austwickia sp.]